MEKETCTKARNFNKPAYVVFVLAAVYFFIVKNFSEAFTFMGLAAIFDPFNVNMPFNKRPLYQRVWLYVHVAVTIAMLVLMLWWK